MALDWISRACFDLIRQTNLVYNACWESSSLNGLAGCLIFRSLASRTIGFWAERRTTLRDGAIDSVVAL
jgi:hypothetical protein